MTISTTNSIDTYGQFRFMRSPLSNVEDQFHLRNDTAPIAMVPFNLLVKSQYGMVKLKFPVFATNSNLIFCYDLFSFVFFFSFYFVLVSVENFSHSMLSPSFPLCACQYETSDCSIAIGQM